MRSLRLLAILAAALPVYAQMAFVEVPNSGGGIYRWSTFDTARNRLVTAQDGILVGQWDGAAWVAGSSWSGAGTILGLAYDQARQRVVVTTTLAPSSPTGFTLEWDGTSWFGGNVASWPTSEICYDPTRNRCVGFATVGGFTRLVSWDGASWIPEPVPPAPFPPYSFLVFDEARARLVVLPTGSSGNFFASSAWQCTGGIWIPLPSPPAAIGRPVYDHVNQDILCPYVASLSMLRLATTWVSEPSNFGSVVGSIWSFDAHLCSTPSGRLYWPFSARGVLMETLRHPQAPLATATAYGQGCAGPLGVPDLTVTGGTVPNQPVLGVTTYVTLSGIPPYGLAYPYMMVGFNNQVCMGQPLPMNLAQFGMPGCELLTSSDFLFLDSLVGFTVPALASFAGMHLYFQGMALNLLGPNGPHASFTSGYDCVMGLPH